MLEGNKKGIPLRMGAPDPEQSDPTPVAMPAGARRPTPIHELIARMVHQAVNAESNEEHGSFEEEDDFTADEPDELLDFTPYQLTEVQEDQPINLRPRAQPTPEAASEAPQEQISPEPESPPAPPGEKASDGSDAPA